MDNSRQRDKQKLTGPVVGHHKMLKQKSQKSDTVTEMLNSSVKAKIAPPHPCLKKQTILNKKTNLEKKK